MMNNRCYSMQNFFTIISRINKILQLKENTNIQKEKIKEYLLSIMAPEIEGYLYCLHNEYYNIYEVSFYKIGSTDLIDRRLLQFNKIYLSKCEVKRLIKVQHKLLFEFFMMCNLCKYRVSFVREYFINYDEINKEFTFLENLIKIKSYNELIDYYIDKILENKSINFIFDYENRVKINPNIDITDYFQLRFEIKNNNHTILNNFKNCLSINTDNKKLVSNDKINIGYIKCLSYNSFNEYYGNNISLLLIDKTNDYNIINTYFIDSPNVIKILKVNYLDVSQFIINDLIGNKKINKYIYYYPILKMKSVIELIDYYNKTYTDKKSIYYSYIRDRYNIINNNITINTNNIVNEYNKKFIDIYNDILKYNVKEELEYILDKKLNLEKIKNDNTMKNELINEVNNKNDKINIEAEKTIIKTRKLRKKGIYIDTSK